MVTIIIMLNRKITMFIIFAFLANLFLINVFPNLKADKIIELKIDSNKIKINGVDKKIDNNNKIKIIINKENGHILIPLRCIAEALEYKVDWDNINKIVILKKKSIELKLDINKSLIIAYKDNKNYTGYLNFYQTNIIYDRTHVSLNFIADILNCEIEWESKNKVIKIMEKDDILNLDFWNKNLDKKYVEAQYLDEEKVKNKIIEDLKNIQPEYKTDNVMINFKNIFYEHIFINNLNYYFSDCIFVEKSEYTGTITIKFNTIKEAEEAVKALNKWNIIKYAYLGTLAFPAN